MEEQRIGMMYVNSFIRKLTGLWDGLFPRGLRRSPLLPLMVIGLVIFVPAAGWYLHMRNKFHNIRAHIEGVPNRPDVPRPGGLDPLVLTHHPTAGSPTPQFTRVTLLPGLGMDVLQIAAYLPGHGEVQLLLNPTVKDMADGTAGPRSSQDDLRGALELPWAGGLTGTVSLLGTTMIVNFAGRTMEVPTDPTSQAGVSWGGLLASHGADMSTLSSNATEARATFNGLDFDQHWASSNEVQVLARLSGNALELTVTARNTGTQPEPMGIGWHPRFMLPGGDRATAEFVLPTGELMTMATPSKDAPDGRLTPLTPALAAFEAHPGTLGDKTLDAVIGHLKPSRGETDPSAVLIDRRAGFALRMTALSNTVREFRVSAPAGESYVAMGMQTNYEDPLGREWSELSDPGIVTLQPGETLAWRVRLEIEPAPR